jgi:hypothetical protein
MSRLFQAYILFDLSIFLLSPYYLLTIYIISSLYLYYLLTVFLLSSYLLLTCFLQNTRFLEWANWWSLLFFEFLCQISMKLFHAKIRGMPVFYHLLFFSLLHQLIVCLLQQVDGWKVWWFAMLLECNFAKSVSLHKGRGKSVDWKLADILGDGMSFNWPLLSLLLFLHVDY